MNAYGYQIPTDEEMANILAESREFLEREGWGKGEFQIRS